MDFLEELPQYNTLEQKMAHVAEVLGWEFDPDVWELTKTVQLSMNEQVHLSYEVIIRPNKQADVEWDEAMEMITHLMICRCVVDRLVALEKERC